MESELPMLSSFTKARPTNACIHPETGAQVKCEGVIESSYMMTNFKKRVTVTTAKPTPTGRSAGSAVGHFVLVPYCLPARPAAKPLQVNRAAYERTHA